jgi:hypothetical protein
VAAENEVRAVRGGWTGRRSLLVASAAALVLAGGTTAALTLGNGVATVLPAASPTAAVPRPPLLPAAGPRGPAPSAAGLSRALASGLTDKALGGHVAISVLDATTGEPVLETSAR